MIDHSPLRLGTRGSQLALIQADIACKAIAAATGRRCDIVTVKTTGDKVLDRPLAEIGGKALFAKELEEALLGGRIDCAVHSLKDLPVDPPEGLQLTAVLPRESPYDALVLPKGGGALVAAARIGSCSVRRAAQIRRQFKDARVLPLRGNVDSRLAKLDGGEFDALILAHAGLDRLGLDARIGQVLKPPSFVPALSQGAIGLESRAGDEAVNRVLEAVNDPTTALCIAAERGFQRGMGGTCHSPLAGLARIQNGVLHFVGEVIAPDGSNHAAIDFDMPVEGYAKTHAAAAAAKGLEAGRSLRARPQVPAWLG